MTESDFKQQYMLEFVSDDYEQTNVCIQCISFDGGCTTSRIEAKYGNGNTQACTEFIMKDK